FEPPTPSPPDWCANQAALRSEAPLLPRAIMRVNGKAAAASAGQLFQALDAGRQPGDVRRWRRSGEHGGGVNALTELQVANSRRRARGQHRVGESARALLGATFSRARAEDAEARQQPADTAAFRLGEGFEPHPRLQEALFAFVRQRCCTQRGAGLLNARTPRLTEAHAPRAFHAD